MSHFSLRNFLNDTIYFKLNVYNYKPQLYFWAQYSKQTNQEVATDETLFRKPLQACMQNKISALYFETENTHLHIHLFMYLAGCVMCNNTTSSVATATNNNVC